MKFQSLLLNLLLAFVVFSGSAFGQAIGSITGVVSDVSQAKIPGTSVTAINTSTGVKTTTLSNETGAYNFPSLAVGPYQLEAALTGFRAARVENIDLRSNQTLRYNLTMEIGSVGTTVAVTIDAQELLAVSSSSIGQALSQDQVAALPIVGGDVLDLINTLPGFRLGGGGPGANSDTMAGAASSTINTVRDGLSVTDGRFPNGAFATTVLNPDMVGEVKLILTPVDAEMGRGNGQVQITTRSGTNRYTGSAVWSIRNSALNANTWDRNNDVDPKTGLWKPTVPDWQNQNQLTFSYGGPIIKNKTFFFGLFDKNFVKTRANVNGLVLTDTARQGIFRYFDGWTPDDADATPGTTSRPAVDFLGNPLFSGNPGSSLICFSVFGTQKVNPDTFQMTPFTQADCPGGTAYFPNGGAPYWDAGRQTADTTGFMQNFLALMPHANRFQGGDGLNTAQVSWTRSALNQGINSASAYGGDANIERTQFNIKIDHNFSSNHKANFGYSVERDTEGTNFSDWPDNPYGQTRRAPWVLTSSFTSSLSSSMINEARFGIRYNVLNEYNPWEHPDKEIADVAKKFFIQGGEGYPTVFNPALLSNANSPYNNGDYNGNRTPLYSFGDTLSWTRGTHSFKFGGEVRLTKSVAYNAVGGTPLPTLTGGAGANIASNISSTSGGLPGLITTPTTGAQDQARSLLYFFNGSVNQGSQLYWIDNADDVQNGKWETYNTLERKYRDQVTNEAAFFIKDDWKIGKSLTLNLGVRWEYYGVPFIGSGFTTATPGLGLGLFGVGRGVLGSTSPFDKWLLAPGNVYLNSYGPGGSLQCNMGQASGVAGIPASNCDPNQITTVEFVGPNSPNPEKTVYPNDFNNFGPAIGFAWQPPFGKEGQTTLRGGYQMTFGGAGRGGSGAESYLGGAPGATSNALIDFPALGNPYLNLSNVSTIVPIKPTSPALPGGTLGAPYSHPAALNYTAFDPNYTTPYIQNFTLSMTHQVNRNFTVDVRYAGTQAKKQIGLGFFGQNTINLNTSNVYYNTELFNALESVRRGGEAPILDQLFAGLNLNQGTNAVLNGVNVPYTAVGTTSGGVVQTAALHLRRRFATDLANGNYVNIATFINSNNGGNPTTGLLAAQAVSNLGGRILRNGCDRMANGQTTVGTAIPTPLRCFPEDYLVANPQFTNANYNSNTGSSNYHSLETQFTVRPTSGTSIQGTYTWAKSMETPGTGWTDPLNRDGDYRIAANHRGHEFRMNGTFELPFGPNKLVLGNSTGALARAVEGWRFSWTYNAFSGAPASIGAQNMLYGNGVPDVVGPWNLNGGEVQWGQNVGGANLGGTYFGPVGTYQVVTDPACAPGGILDATDAMGFNVRTGVANGCPLRAIADSSGKIVLQNAAPGKRGTLGQQTIIGPGSWTMDGSLNKQFRITESKSVQLRFDATNILNHPQPNNPQYSINNAAFGTIAAKGNQTRVFQGQLRFLF